MQKTLIIQVEVGNTPGYIYGGDNAIAATESAEIMRSRLIPTVKRYCETYGYDYKQITEYPKDLDITYFNYSSKGEDYDFSKGGKNKCSTLIRYLAMGDDDYDRIVVLDNDIWITPWADPLPDVKGHHGVEDLGKDYSRTASQMNLPFGKFINGGVQMVDKEAGKSLNRYITEAIKNKTPPPGGRHTDQSYMNHWRAQNISLAYTLPFKWNFMVGFHKESFESASFVHFAGGQGRTLLVRNKDIIK
tara:strand:+ start:4502 stop:5239 length:738 start_codon:yes stop_codon:yes gene_type:complete